MLFITAVSGFCQDNVKHGLLFLDDCQYHKAQSSFLAQLKTAPQDSRIYCYLGDAYLGLNLLDSAKTMYQKALELDSKSPFPVIGFGKLALQKGDRMGKVEFFDKARKMDRKNPEVYNEIAKGCLGLSKTDTATANNYLKQGFELDAKYARLHITYGDYEAAGERFGNAINAYERALFFDPTLAIAHRKLGQLHSFARSYRDAINSFTKSIEMNKDQILAYKNLGDLYYSRGRYIEAEKNYEIYLSKADVSYDDKERYAIILFFNKKYSESANLLEEVMKHNSDESVLLRIRGYIAYETGDYVKGLEYMAKFFKLHDPSRNLSSDHVYYGRLLQKNGKDTLAIDNYLKALALDSTKTELHEDLAKLYSGNKMHVKAADRYKRMIANGADKVNSWFQIGKEYYFEGDINRTKYDSLMGLQKGKKIQFIDSTSVNETTQLYFQKADSAFTTVTILNPNYAPGFYWKGRVQSFLDPQAENTIGKEAYEKAATLLLSDEVKNRTRILECYRYLVSYYYLNSEKFLKTDKAKSEAFKNNMIDYFRKILAIDPNDKQALEVFSKLKIK